MSTATLEPALPRSDPLPRSRVRGRLADLGAIAFPCALALVLVLYELATRSLWLDESATVAISAQHGAALWHAIGRDGGNMLGYYLLLHLLTDLFGHAPAVIRAPSAVGFVGTVAFVGLIARRLFDRRAALAAGLLCAVSVPLVFWGQDARSYAVMTMFIAASFFALIVLLEGNGPRSRWSAAAYVVSIVLAIYMSFVAVLVVPAHLIVLVARRERARVRVVVSALAVAGVCCVPIFVLAVSRGSSQLFWVPAPSLKRFVEMGRWLTSAGMPPNFHTTATGTPLLIVSTLVLVVVLAGVARRGREIPWGVWLVVCWLLVPLALVLAESLSGQPIALARNSLISLPAFALVVGWALTRPGRSPWLGWSVLGVLIALRALQLAPSYGISSENWKAATQHVLGATRAGDCIAFYPSDGRMAFAYYVPSGAPAPTSVLPAIPWSDTAPFVERYVVPSAARLAQVEASCPRLWLIASHEGFRTGPAGSRVNYARYQALRGSLARAYGRSTTLKYGWASPVRVELLSR